MDKETGLPEGASTYSAGTNTDPWTEVRIEVPAERIDAAGDIAHMTVPYGIYLEDYRFLEEEIDEIAHIDLIDEALKDKESTSTWSPARTRPKRSRSCRSSTQPPVSRPNSPSSPAATRTGRTTGSSFSNRQKSVRNF